MRKDLKYIIVGCVFLTIFYFCIKVYSDYYFEKYGIETICYTTKYSVNSKQKSVIFIFYIDGKKNFGERLVGNQEIHLNKYYRMIYSKIDPKKTRVDFKKEVKDSMSIKKAGFIW